MQHENQSNLSWEDTINTHDLPYKQQPCARTCPVQQTRAAFQKCLTLSPVLGIPPEISSVLGPIRKYPCSSVQSICDSEVRGEGSPNMYTWKVRGSMQCIVFKLSPTETGIYDTSTNMCYIAAPCCSLGPGCPVGTSFLAQITIDSTPILPLQPQQQQYHHSRQSHESDLDTSLHDSGIACGQDDCSSNPAQCLLSQDSNNGIEIGDEDSFLLSPSVLLMDVISIGHSVNFVHTPCPAKERYNALIEMADPSRGIIVSQVMQRQWVGFLDALITFHTDKGCELPHMIDCYVRLGSTSPMEMMFVKASSVS